jgi:hypothetical protein
MSQIIHIPCARRNITGTLCYGYNCLNCSSIRIFVLEKIILNGDAFNFNADKWAAYWYTKQIIDFHLCSRSILPPELIMLLVNYIILYMSIHLRWNDHGLGAHANYKANILWKNYYPQYLLN